MRKIPSLSRSYTLNRLQDRSRAAAEEHNNYRGFNHHNWLLSIRWIFKGSGSNMFIPLGVSTLFSAAVVVTVELLHAREQVDLDTDVTTGLSGCMALLLAFRLNVCYSRWWEGRLLWGRVIEGARSLVTIALALEADAEPGSEEAKYKRGFAEGLAGWSIAFAVALKFHLRGDAFEGDKCEAQISRLLKGKGLAFGSTAIHRLKQSRHPPLHALRSIRHAIRRVVRESRSEGAEVIALENQFNTISSEFHIALTGCERILRTPCPPGYVGVLRVSLVFFLMLLPFVLLEIGYWLIPVVFCTGFVLLGAEEVAIQLEQPFGDDQNDLPLDSYCYTLEADLMSLLDEKVEALAEMSEEDMNAPSRFRPPRPPRPPRPLRPSHEALLGRPLQEGHEEG